MAVPKTTQTRYMDGSVQRTTQVTPSLHHLSSHKDISSNLTAKFRYTFYSKKKKRCRDGVTCVVLCTLPSIYLVCVVFGTAILTSFYIFGKCFSYFFACILCCTTVPYRRLSFSKLSTGNCWLARLSICFLGSYSEVKLSDATLILGGAVSFGREMHNAT